MTQKKQRRSYTAAFKSKVALEALDDNVDLSALAERYGVHPGLVSQWKQVLVENRHRLFEASPPKKDDRDREIEALQRKVDALTAEYDFLKNVLSAHKKSVKG